MLHQLAIKNYATVDSLVIEFKPGMSAITGETGAGKSIILGALGLTLGDRADKTVIRSGTQKADISAEFDMAHIAVAQTWLGDNDLESADQPGLCILRRVISSDGRSRAYINGSPVTLTNLKELGEMLLDIHSQHEHQSLLHRQTHRRLLDEFGVQAELLDELGDSFQNWHDNFELLENLSQQSSDDSAQIQLLSYQLNELDELELGEGELESLETEFSRLNSADDLISAVNASLQISDEDESGNIESLLNQALAGLRKVAPKDIRIANMVGLLEAAEIQLSEAIAEMRDFADGFDADPERLEQINSRLSRIHNLARKHRIEPTALPELTRSLRSQLNDIEHSDEKLAELKALDADLREQFRKVAEKVSRQRQKATQSLANQVNAQLQQLGMPNARLEINLMPVNNDNPSSHGLESVEFLVSTNPGQEAKPLIKIASGGELSRISLAIQVITAQTSQTPSLVFDEVDVGIGGGVAKVVGELLRKLGESAQIICVTHQAQVASQAHNHLVVSKHTDDKSALTRIVELKQAEKVKEVARMLGGDEFSDESLAHAEQMVAS